MFAGPTTNLPANWHVCDGSLQSMSTYQALYAVLGTTYGGDGRTTFALPDLRGRVPMGTGSGPGLTPRTLGAFGGTETVALSAAQMPAHSHAFNATSAAASTLTPRGNMFGNISNVTANLQIAPSPGQVNIYQDPLTSSLVTLNGNAISTEGAGAPHDNMMPSAVIQFIICMNGIFPVTN